MRSIGDEDVSTTLIVDVLEDGETGRMVEDLSEWHLAAKNSAASQQVGELS